MADARKRPAAKKSAAKKSAGKKSAAKKKSPAKKSAARTPAAKKSTSKPTGTRGAASRKGRKKKPVGARRVIGNIFKGLVIALCLAVVVGAGVVVLAYHNTEIPDPNADFQTNNTTVYYRDGETEVGAFAVQNRESIPYEEMPQAIKDAVVAAENRDFWTDRGFSITGMARAALQILAGGDVSGGSTITQQYIKIYYLTSDQTLTRKFTELLLAAKLSREVPKEQILQDYLNTIWFGRGAYGIQAAAEAYFGIDAKDMTVEQSAVLASVLNNPSLYDPSEGEKNEARLLDRYRWVLSSMVETGTLDAATAEKAKKKLPEFPEIKQTNRYGGPSGFLLMMVKDELKRAGFSDSEIEGGGLQVISTFDSKAQAAAVKTAQQYEKTANANNPDGDGVHIALSSVDVGTGEVRALYGNKDYVENSRNWATTPRASGSTFKTYALAAALEDGFSLQTMLKGNTYTPPGDTSTIRNEFHHNYGPVTLLRAVSLSINTAFVDMTTQMEDGPAKIIKAAEDAGVPQGNETDWYPGNRISLGIADVSPLDNATGYATYANGGEYVETHVVREVRDLSGKVIWQANPERRQAVDQDVAADITFALSNVVSDGSGAAVGQIGRPVAGKTGTASGGPDESEVRSAWFVGYTAQISTAVMVVAGDSGSADLHPYRRPGDGTFFGGTYPAQTWADYMTAASQGMDVEEFPPAANVNKPTNPPVTRPPSTPPPTTQPPSTEPPTSDPPTSDPPTSDPPTTDPPTTDPPTTDPPTSDPPTSDPPTSEPPPPSKPTKTPDDGGDEAEDEKDDG